MIWFWDHNWLKWGCVQVLGVAPFESQGHKTWFSGFVSKNGTHPRPTWIWSYRGSVPNSGLVEGADVVFAPGWQKAAARAIQMNEKPTGTKCGVTFEPRQIDRWNVEIQTPQKPCHTSSIHRKLYDLKSNFGRLWSQMRGSQFSISPKSLSLNFFFQLLTFWAHALSERLKNQNTHLLFWSVTFLQTSGKIHPIEIWCRPEVKSVFYDASVWREQLRGRDLHVDLCQLRDLHVDLCQLILHLESPPVPPRLKKHTGLVFHSVLAALAAARDTKHAACLPILCPFLPLCFRLVLFEAWTNISKNCLALFAFADFMFHIAVVVVVVVACFVFTLELSEIWIHTKAVRKTDPADDANICEWEKQMGRRPTEREASALDPDPANPSGYAWSACRVLHEVCRGESRVLPHHGEPTSTPGAEICVQLSEQFPTGLSPDHPQSVFPTCPGVYVWSFTGI